MEDVVLILLVLPVTKAVEIDFEDVCEAPLESTEARAETSTTPLTQYATDASKLLQAASICVFHDLS